MNEKISQENETKEEKLTNGTNQTKDQLKKSQPSWLNLNFYFFIKLLNLL